MRGILAITLLVAGCAGNECESGDAVCVDSTTRRHCVADRDGHAVNYVWRNDTCPEINAYCVEPAQPAAAVCASASQRSPSCANGDYCADGVAYRCVDGFPIIAQTCGSAGCGARECLP